MLQPGRYDGGADDDVVARLLRFVPIELELSQPDCKIAGVTQKLLNKMIRRIRRNYEVKIQRFAAETNLVDAAVARPISRDLITCLLYTSRCV